jgi:hypothetical protein
MNVARFHLENFADGSFTGRIVPGIPYIVGAAVFPSCAMYFFDSWILNEWSDSTRPLRHNVHELSSAGAIRHGIQALAFTVEVAESTVNT